MRIPSRFISPIVTNNRVAFLCGVIILAAGFGAGSAALANGLVRMQRTDREVTVRGVAQRDVTANRATWSVGYSEHAYSLAEALAAVDRDTALIRAYLAGHGFEGRSTEPGSARISSSDEFVADKPTGRTIYSVSRHIGFSTPRVAQVQAVENGKDALAEQGLVVDSTGASFEYTQLDTIKPEMIAEATRDARQAAGKFAEDSGSQVGGIRSATQGYFTVTSRDSAASDDYDGYASRTASSAGQRVRVVTTIVYYLD